MTKIEQVSEAIERKAMAHVRVPDSNTNKVIAEQRTKLDIRTWILRIVLGALFFSLSLNMTLIITLLTLLL